MCHSTKSSMAWLLCTWKIQVKLENQTAGTWKSFFEKEIIFQTSMIRFHVRFRGVYQSYCWWQPEIRRNSPVEGTVDLPHYLQGFSTIQTVVIAGFLPPVPYLKAWRSWRWFGSCGRWGTRFFGGTIRDAVWGPLSCWSPLKGGCTPYPLRKVYMGLIIKGVPFQGAPTIFPMNVARWVALGMFGFEKGRN